MALISECGSSLLLTFCGGYISKIFAIELSVTAYPERDIAEHNSICDAVLSRMRLAA